jgi:3-methyladenine DNA glycosylase AlkD
MSLVQLKNELKQISNKEHAKILARFFKTGPGEYGDGDVFIGIKVPPLRAIAKKFLSLGFEDIQTLLNSEIHEERLAALMILTLRFPKANETEKQEIVNIYLKNTKRINNWDLVDLSADRILGAYLFDKDKTILEQLAKSENLWERRLAVMSTFHFIKNNRFSYALKIYRLVINDEHDLIHKAVGWMLREIGKRDLETEEKFLRKHYKKMPRTMLRYAIERFDEEKRLAYLKGNV